MVDRAFMSRASAFGDGLQFIKQLQDSMGNNDSDDSDDSDVSEPKMGGRFAARKSLAPPGETTFRAVEIPEKYFFSRMRRRPYSGAVFANGVDRDLDFQLVDLHEREEDEDYCENVDRLSRWSSNKTSEMYLFRPRVLEYRSWIYADLFNYENSPEGTQLRSDANDGRNVPPPARNELVKRALEPFLVESLSFGTFGRDSPIFFWAPICFFANFTGDWGLAWATIACFFVLNMCANSCNTAGLWPWARVASLPMRLGVLGTVAPKLASTVLLAQEGMGFELLSIVTVVLLALFDILRGDVMIIFGRSFETRYEILDELPGGVYICRKLGRTGMGLQGDHTPYTPCREFLGDRNFVPPKHTVVVVDCEGLLLELDSVKFKEWAKWKDDVVPTYNTKTFGEARPDYDAVRAKQRSDAAQREFAERLKRGSLVTDPSVLAGK